MDLQGFSNRDKSIINSNQGLELYEYEALGVSKKGLEKLEQLLSTESKETDKPLEVEEVKQEIEVKEVVQEVEEVQVKEVAQMHEDIVSVKVEDVSKVVTSSINRVVNVGKKPKSKIIVTVLCKKTNKQFQMPLKSAEQLNRNNYKIL